MVVVSILPHAEFGSNDHREDAPHFIPSNIALASISYLKNLEPREFPLEFIKRGNSGWDVNRKYVF